jgi:hypothetical protein
VMTQTSVRATVRASRVVVKLLFISFFMLVLFST